MQLQCALDTPLLLPPADTGVRAGAAASALSLAESRGLIRTPPAAARGAEAAACSFRTAGSLLRSCSIQEQLKRKMGNLSTGAGSKSQASQAGSGTPGTRFCLASSPIINCCANLNGEALTFTPETRCN